MIIHVEQKHIDAGVRGDCERCTVALALKEQVPDARAVVVGVLDVDIFFTNRFDMAYSYALSQRVQQQTANFDNGKPVKPFNFRLNI